LPVVTGRVSSRAYAAAERGIRDDSARPHAFDQLFLGDHTVAILDEHGQKGEYLGLDGPELALEAQLQSVGVNLTGSESVSHGNWLPRELAEIPSGSVEYLECPEKDQGF
jgi:hypothetical protein